MNLSIQLFAQARDIAQRDRIEIEFPAQATVADLRNQLVQHIPELETIAPHLLIAVENEYATDDTILKENTPIACFPPVSGG